MKTLLTVLAFALLCGFLYVLGSRVPRADLLGVLGVTLALVFWDLFVHDRVSERRAGKSPAGDPREAELEPALDEPGTLRDDGRRVEGLER